MPHKFYGQQRETTLRRLVDEWLPGGPPVAILQGFPGCGKTQLAVSVAAKATRSLDPVEPQTDSADPVLDLFFDLAFALEANGISNLVQEFDKGAKANLGRALLEILRHQEILIVVDEFQRLLPNESTQPPKEWATVVEQLNVSIRPLGRLLLVSNRSIKTARWCENSHVEELRGLPDQEAEALFTEILESKGLQEKVPLERRRAICHRLSGNPRALKTLVTALRTDSLIDLLPEAPALGMVGDVVLDARLLEDFERELLERALPKMEASLVKFMRWLSVHRRPFQKEALAQFTGGLEAPEALRQRLFDRFLLEQVAGGDAPHELAREISVNRLRRDSSEWKQAHSLAANFHMRRFEARQLSATSTLPASYAELRHHLYEAGRIDEIHRASERLTKYALSHIGLVTPVPTNKEVLEERIALLSAIPDGERPKVLEYHLARCFERRAGAGDKERALKHARQGTGRHPASSPWVFRLDLEFDLHGIDAAKLVIAEALRSVGSDGDASPIYQRGGELMAKANRLDDAIKLLEKGLAIPGLTNIFSLYQSCAELMAKANRLDDAIKLLEKGLAIPGLTNIFSLYQSCAELMAKANRLDDAIKLLEKGLAVVPASQRFILYQTELEIIGRAGDCPKAERVLARGLAAIPASSGRYKIAETGLRVLRSCGGPDAVKRLLNLEPPSQLDPSQRVLANYSLAQLSGDWQKAFDVIHKGHEDFPRYGAILFGEADAHVALGRTAEAYTALRSYEAGLTQERDNPAVWLKAFVCLASGHLEEARTLAAMFAPNDFNAGVALDEAEILRLWSVAQGGAQAPLSNSFPGIAEYTRRRDAKKAAAEMSLAAHSPKRPCVLAVATEWDSRHGGISTFNRDLCAALAAAGSSVVCYVPQIRPGEVERALGVRVALVEALEMAGSQDALLFQRPRLPSGFTPEIIIGHDRITGAASVALARDHYPASRRVLFIHTSPEEIEWHKEPREDSTSAERAAERKREQLGLASGCDLVVAVGPHLASEFGTDLHGAGNATRVMELTPGLPERPANQLSTPPPAIRCLVLGRVEDYQLKGLDLAARALGRVVAAWKQGNPPKLVVRGAPIGTDEALRERLGRDSAPTELDIVIRHYSADETEILSDLREASLVLMPSRKEGFGLVGLEAIACGVPTLISAQSGLAETLRRQAPELAEGWILPVGNAVTKWAERMEMLLTGRVDAFARAAALRGALATKLDWKRAVQDLLAELAKTETR